MQPLYKNEKQLFMDFQDFLNPGFIFRHPREKEKRGTHRTCSVLHNRPVLLVDSPAYVNKACWIVLSYPLYGLIIVMVSIEETEYLTY